jgi:hypothetical protein
MGPGSRRTTIARVAAGLAFLCGALGLLSAIANETWLLSSHGWGTGGILLLLIGLFILVDGAVSFEKSRTSALPKY